MDLYNLNAPLKDGAMHHISKFYIGLIILNTKC